MKISAHCMVRNEEKFIWYSVMSVINHVDKILLWDTGSTDRTVPIITEILKTREGGKKVEFRKVGETDAKGLARFRQEMLEETSFDWVLILDGDEVWWEDGIKRLRKSIETYSSNKDLVVCSTRMLIGDMFHYQEKLAGKYSIGGKIGHNNIRAIKRNILGLHIEGVYPDEAYVDVNGVKIQNFPEEKMVFLNDTYLHLSHLERSSCDRKKFKFEIGERFPLDYYYPEVFFKPRPEIVPSPWESMSVFFRVRAMWQTPLKKIRRRFI